jgi:hypothetical protein
MCCVWSLTKIWEWTLFRIATHHKYSLTHNAFQTNTLKMVMESKVLGCGLFYNLSSKTNVGRNVVPFSVSNTTSHTTAFFFKFVQSTELAVQSDTLLLHNVYCNISNVFGVMNCWPARRAQRIALKSIFLEESFLSRESIIFFYFYIVESLLSTNLLRFIVITYEPPSFRTLLKSSLRQTFLFIKYLNITSSRGH